MRPRSQLPQTPRFALLPNPGGKNEHLQDFSLSVCWELARTVAP